MDETNFRDFAERAVKKYNDMGMIVDAMLWSARGLLKKARGRAAIAKAESQS